MPRAAIIFWLLLAIGFGAHARRDARLQAFDRVLKLTFGPERKTLNDKRGIIASGSSGAVSRHGRRVVSKTVEPTFDIGASWRLTGKTVRRLLAQEVFVQRAINAIAPKLSPRVLAFRPGDLSFSMEYVAGKPLGSSTRADLNPGALRRLRKQMRAVHGAGYAHGDIKPGNILVVNGELVLLDWGCSRRRLDDGGLATAMDRFLRISFEHPGPVDLFAFDRRALARLGSYIHNLPAPPK